jgi:hypothetical protein
MLVNIAVFIVLSLNKYANILVTLLLVQTSVLNTTFSGQCVVANHSDPIGVQAIEPLFNYFTSTPLLTTKIIISWLNH